MLKIRTNPRKIMEISKLENEVARLKTKGDEVGKLINQLVGRIERLEASKDAKKECSSDKVIERPKTSCKFTSNSKFLIISLYFNII